MTENKWWKRRERFKIEFFPALINLPLVAMFIILLVSNRGYWDMFNWTISGLFNNVYRNYIAILLIILAFIGAYSVALLAFGLFHKLHWVHKPIVNIFPNLFLFAMTLILFTLLNIEERVGLDYIFFSLGPGTAELVYIGLSIGICLFIGIILYFVLKLVRSPIAGSGRYEGKRFYPKVAATTTVISLVLVIPIISALLFKYPQTDAYWMNIEVIFTRYAIWNIGYILAWIFGVITTVVGQFIYFREDCSSKKGYFVLLFGTIGQLIGIIGLSVLLEQQTRPYITGLSAYLFIPLIGVLLFSWSIQIKQVIEVKIIKRIQSVQKARLIRVLIIIAMLLIPYWFVFYQPLVFGAPGVDLPSQTHLRMINGIEVPFQNNTPYPSFEWQSTAYRSYINLSGDWKYWEGTGSEPSSAGPRTSERMKYLTQGQHLPDFDDTQWTVVQVPHSINMYEDEAKYWGVVWYRRYIDIPQEFTNQSLTLKFLGVNYYCDVWIDGNYVGYHEGMFTAFAFDLTEYLSPGQHLIAVRVDNPEWGPGIFNHRMTPNGGDFFNYGGIEREVWLEAAQNPSVIRADIRQGIAETTNHINGTQELDITIIMNLNPSQPKVNYTLGIYPLEFSTEDALKSRDTWQYIQWDDNVTEIKMQSIDFSTTREENIGAFRISLLLPQVTYWSTKNPQLYAVTINLTDSEHGISDFFCTQVGFRNISVNGTQLLLNGAPLKLAGASVHEQYPGPTGRMLSDEQRFTDLTLLQDLNANWWRGSYPFHPMTYVYSDRLGLACWEEAPVFWVNEIDIVQAYTRNYYQTLWIEILYRDINRPSVLFWGATNEPWAQGPLYDYLEDLRQWLDVRDPSRILSFAAVSSHDSWTQGFKHLQVCTPNTYAGTFEGVRGDWYNELTRQLWRVANNTHNAGKPIVSMEFGYWRGGDDDDQKRCFEECFRAYSEHPWVQGMTWWVFADYYGYDYYNAMGVFNHNRTWSAPIYDVMQASYLEYTAQNL